MVLLHAQVRSTAFMVSRRTTAAKVAGRFLSRERSGGGGSFLEEERRRARVGEGLVVLLIREEKGGRWMKGRGGVEHTGNPLPDMAMLLTCKARGGRWCMPGEEKEGWLGGLGLGAACERGRKELAWCCLKLGCRLALV